MFKLLMLIAAFSTLLVANYARAIPTAYYNLATGDVRLLSDTSLYLSAFFMASKSGVGFTADAAAFTKIAGSQFDRGDLPAAFAYFFIPRGAYDLGNIVVPGTVIDDLSGGYYPDGCLECERQLNIVPVLEPASWITAGIAIVGITAVVRDREGELRGRNA